MTSAAGVELEPIWATLLAKALEGKNVKELLSNVGAGGAAPAAGGAAPAAAAGGAGDAPKEEEKKEEEKEESDDDMVCLSIHSADSTLANGGTCAGLRTLRLICILCHYVALISSFPHVLHLGSNPHHAVFTMHIPHLKNILKTAISSA